IGHSYTTIAADVLARYHRAEGHHVRFLTGTDEHGIKIYKAAQDKGTTPDALADSVVVNFMDLWKALEISHDDFIRTSEDRHEKRVQELVRQLVETDEIYKGRYEGWYDEGQEEFVTESTARENDYKGPLSGKPLVKYEEENWFFRLGKWVPKLIEHIENHPTFIQPDARRNEVLSKLKQGVEDLCISRNRQKLPWGVEMPNDPEYVVYVWVDALSNYMNALGIPEVGDDNDGRFAEFWPADVHLIGKDILWFHAVYWPCLLMALGRPLPKCVFAHGWWTSEGKKMSKSLGNFISREVIHEIAEEYSVDVFRYYLLRAMNFGADGDFSQEMFRQRYNTELANGVGNLLSRTVNMIGRYFDATVPPASQDVQEAIPVKQVAAALREDAPGLMAEFQLHAYIQRVMDLVDATNKFIEDTEPFRLAKDDSQRVRLGGILYTCAEAVRIVLSYLRPVMPATCDAGLAALGVESQEGTLSELGAFGRIEPETETRKIDPLFPRKK
ncbi:MAG: methionine--tRNA ligase, partial [Phycisphaerae bacterium]